MDTCCADLVCCECGNDTVMVGLSVCAQCAHEGADVDYLPCWSAHEALVAEPV